MYANCYICYIIWNCYNNSAHRFRSKWRFSGSTEWKRCWVWDACLQSGLSFLFSWSDSPVPNSFHSRADRTSREGILPGELRVQAAEMRTGCRFKPTWDYNQGRPECLRRTGISLACNRCSIICVKRHIKPWALQNRVYRKGDQITAIKERKINTRERMIKYESWSAAYSCYYYYYYYYL